jgi:8-oxo-dGTP diphosphatase
MKAQWVYGEAEVMEPEKCQCWEWFSWDELPSPMMIGIKDIFDRGEKP